MDGWDLLALTVYQAEKRAHDIEKRLTQLESDKKAR